MRTLRDVAETLTFRLNVPIRVELEGTNEYAEAWTEGQQIDSYVIPPKKWILAFTVEEMYQMSRMRDSDMLYLVFAKFESRNVLDS